MVGGLLSSSSRRSSSSAVHGSGGGQTEWPAQGCVPGVGGWVGTPSPCHHEHTSEDDTGSDTPSVGYPPPPSASQPVTTSAATHPVRRPRVPRQRWKAAPPPPQAPPNPSTSAPQCHRGVSCPPHHAPTSSPTCCRVGWPESSAATLPPSRAAVSASEASQEEGLRPSRPSPTSCSAALRMVSACSRAAAGSGGGGGGAGGGGGQRSPQNGVGLCERGVGRGVGVGSQVGTHLPVSSSSLRSIPTVSCCVTKNPTFSFRVSL